MGARRNFRRGAWGRQAQKKDPQNEVKSSKKAPIGEKAPQNKKNVAKRPPYEEKVAKVPQNKAKKPFFLFLRGGGGGRRSTLAPPCLQSRGFNNHYFLYKK